MKTSFAFLMLFFLILAGCSSNDIGVSNINSTGNGGSYSISGSVTLGNGDGISGVHVTLVGNSIGSNTDPTAITRSDGTFSFTKLTNGNYAVVANRSQYTIAPDQRVTLVNNGNVTLQPLIGTPINYTGGGSTGGGGGGGY
jgi:hypothetical protein